jgi:MFS transporter, BCD family, chlorophyll transporter
MDQVVKIPSFRNGIRRVPMQYLPFADAASAGLPLGRLLRLSLFQVTVGMSAALMVGTLNRVMIVELGVAAWLVALMVAIPLLVAPFRTVTGFRSDTHRSAFGWRRVPFIWTGTMMQFMGLTFMPFALLVLTGQGDVSTPSWFNQAIAGLSFLCVGIGLQTSQTAGLALASDLADEPTRPRVVALMYVMLLVGMVGSSFVFSWMLQDFTPKKMIQVIQGHAVLTLVLNAISLWKQEARDPARAAALKLEPVPVFKDSWQRFISSGKARRFLVTVALGTAAFNMQDIVLEPYGGEILKLPVSATTLLTALFASGSLAAFAVASRKLSTGIDPCRLAAYGIVCGLPGFSGVIFAAPLDANWLFYSGVFCIGFGGGLFSVSTLAAAMTMESKEFVGLALGAWGAVQATAAGVSIAFGGAMRDLISSLALNGSLGTTLAVPVTGYSFIYYTEICLLFVALIAIGPLVRRATLSTGSFPTKTERFGLADLPS